MFRVSLPSKHFSSFNSIWWPQYVCGKNHMNQTHLKPLQFDLKACYSLFRMTISLLTFCRSVVFHLLQRPGLLLFSGEMPQVLFPSARSKWWSMIFWSLRHWLLCASISKPLICSFVVWTRLPQDRMIDINFRIPGQENAKQNNNTRWKTKQKQTPRQKKMANTVTFQSTFCVVYFYLQI